MTILVNNTPAVIKKEISFDYIAQNSLFDNKDDYTLQINFPLKDCLANQRIFGCYETVPAEVTPRYNCQIIEGEFRKEGILKVLAVTTHEVQAQFIVAEGVSAEWEDIRLADLALTAVMLPVPPSVTLYDERTQQTIPSQDEYDLMTAEEQQNTRPSRQVYIRSLIRAVAAALGYAIDDSALQDGYLYSHLLCLNPVYDSVPSGLGPTVRYYDLSPALPDWTVKHFFEQVERLFACRVVTDERNATLALVPLTAFYSGNETVITPSDGHEVETLDDEQLSYWKDTMLKYADTGDCDNCQWFIDKLEKEGGVQNCDSLSGGFSLLNQYLEQDLDENSDPAHTAQTIHDNRLLKAAGRYFLIRESQSGITHYIYACVPLNMFRDNGADGGEYALDFKPVQWYWLKQTADNDRRLPVVRTPEPEERFTTGIPTLPCAILANGERDKNDNCIDALYVALAYRDPLTGEFTLWTHDLYETRHTLQPADTCYSDFAHGHHFLDGEQTSEMNPDMSFTLSFLPVTDVVPDLPSPVPSLALYPFPDITAGRIATPDPLSPDAIRRALPLFDRTKKYSFEFLCRGMPDVRSVFVIRGKRYVCRDITARVTADGISLLKKGTFFRLDDTAASAVRDTDMAQEME